MKEPLPLIPDLSVWLATPLGQYVLHQAQTWCDARLESIFGTYAVQLGLPTAPLLQQSPIPQRFCLGKEIHAQAGYLPFASRSVDLLVLPFVLEFTPFPHQVLREAERVLRADGHLALLGFNPHSLWGMRRFWCRQFVEMPWCGHFVPLPRLKDWLSLLSFSLVAGRMLCYAPPCTQTQQLQRWQWLEAAGDRWWPSAGAVYALLATKRTYKVHLLPSRWPVLPVCAPTAVIPYEKNAPLQIGLHAFALK